MLDRDHIKLFNKYSKASKYIFSFCMQKIIFLEIFTT